MKMLKQLRYLLNVSKKKSIPTELARNPNLGWKWFDTKFIYWLNVWSTKLWIYWFIAVIEFLMWNVMWILKIKTNYKNQCKHIEFRLNFTTFVVDFNQNEHNCTQSVITTEPIHFNLFFVVFFMFGFLCTTKETIQVYFIMNKNRNTIFTLDTS